MCVACKVRNDQYDFRAISVGPASGLSADHENVQLLRMLAAAYFAANYCSRSMEALYLVL